MRNCVTFHAAVAHLERIAGVVQDLVDHMRQMDSSGRIDMSAFRGERNDDDEEGMLGEDGEEQ